MAPAILSAHAARELQSIAHSQSGGIHLLTEEKRVIGVLLSPAEYRLLKAAASLAADPNRLLDLVMENERFQRGQEGETLTLEEIFR